jgi:hypothetical protein
MTAVDLLRELGVKTGLGALELDRNGLCQLVFDGDLRVEFEAPAGGSSFWLAAAVARLPASAGSDFYRELLEANLMGRGTGGAALAVDPDRGEVVLWQRLDADRTDFPLFERELEAFLNSLDVWKERLDQGDRGHGAIEPPALPPDRLFLIRG